MGESGRKTRSDNGRMFLIAVGDRAAKLAWFSLSGSEDVRIDWHTRSIVRWPPKTRQLVKVEPCP
jgi:hypothetical protein